MFASFLAISYWIFREYSEAHFSVKVMVGIFLFSSVFSFVLYGYAKIHEQKKPASNSTSPDIKKNQETVNPEKKEQIKQKPLITCTKTELDLVKYNQSRVSRLISTRGDYQFSSDEVSALIIEFFNKPLANGYYVTEIKSIITFNDLDNNKEVVIKTGVWLNRYSDQLEFDTGEFLELAVAILEDNQLYLLEREYLQKTNKDRYGYQDFRQLKGKSFTVKVELIAKSFGDVVASKTFKFGLKLKPEFEFKLIKSR